MKLGVITPRIQLFLTRKQTRGHSGEIHKISQEATYLASLEGQTLTRGESGLQD